MLKLGNLMQSEIQLQAQCIQWARNTYPAIRRLLWAVPNGGSRNAIEGQQLQASGVLPGVHDVHLFYAGMFYTFEMKVGNNKMTVDRIVNGKKIYGQVEFAEALQQNGGKWYEIRDFITFRTIIENIMV